MNIEVEVKNIYGREVIYPLCPTGKLLAELSDMKTFTPKTINVIKQLGYTITVKQPTISL